MLHAPGRGSRVNRSPDAARSALAADIARVAIGDEAAMGAVYARTSARIYALLLRMLPNKATAEEVLQETYLAVWRSAGQFASGRASPMSWLITIARNKAIDRLRSDQPKVRNQSLDDLAWEPSDPSPSALTRIQAEDEERRLHWCLDQLEARQQEAIRVAFFNGLTYEEIAHRANVPLGTMKSWIRRGLQRLKACLET
jgi:RNA polymerase sigma-70 factor (ECF subfamily)